ncbi:hypothetical protein D083_4084 [Dickeya solani RNS 08.23.3.1.A]|nr:hypothetical protein D083_4084 [Dickeya solani RNS 08.23.3.1.A]
MWPHYKGHPQAVQKQETFLRNSLIIEMKDTVENNRCRKSVRRISAVSTVL